MSDKNIYQRMLLMQDEIRTVSKDTDVSFRSVSYKGVSHDAVVRIVRPVAIKHGVLIVPTVTKWEDMGGRFNVEVTTRFTSADNPADYVEVVTVGQGMDTQDKSAGKAMSYAKKYGLLLALQLETVDGDETRPDKEGIVDAEYLRSLLKKAGRNEKQMLEYFGVKSIEDMDEAQYVEAMNIIKKHK